MKASKENTALKGVDILNLHEKKCLWLRDKFN